MIFTAVSVVLESDMLLVNEMEGFLEVCVNLIGQSEIDIPLIFTASDLTAIGIHAPNVICCSNNPCQIVNTPCRWAGLCCW